MAQIKYGFIELLPNGIFLIHKMAVFIISEDASLSQQKDFFGFALLFCQVEA